MTRARMPLLAGAVVLVCALIVGITRMRTDDRGNLTHYREANRTVTGAQVVFMGDSITDYWPAVGRLFRNNPGYVGRGISAQVTGQMLRRFEPDVLALRPRAVVILGGINDLGGVAGPLTNEVIQGNIASMSELAAARNIKVVLASILPISAYRQAGHSASRIADPEMQRLMERIRAINDWIRAYAEAHGHVYVDYFSAMIDAAGVLGAELSDDDLHPNAAGYAIMEPLVEAGIRKAIS